MIPGTVDQTQEEEDARYKARLDFYKSTLPPGTPPEEAARLAAREVGKTALPNDQARAVAAARSEAATPMPEVPAVPGAPAIPMPAPVKLERESETKTQTWGESGVKLGKDEKTIAEAQQERLNAQAETTREAGQKAEEIATAEGFAAEERAKIHGRTETELATVDKEYQNRLKGLAADDEKLANQKFETLVARASTPKKVGYALSIAVSGIGVALQQAGGVGNARNGALAVINKAIDDDLAVQKLNYDKQIREQARKRGLLEGEYQRGLNMIQLKKANMLDKAAEMARAAGAKQKGEAERLKYEMVAQQLEGQGLQIRKSLAEAERKQFHSGGSKTTTLVQQDPGMGGRAGADGPGRVERENAAAALTQAEELKKLADLVRTNPKAWAEYQKALKAQREADQFAKSKAGGGIMALGRGAGAFESAVEQRLKENPAAREIHSSIAKLKVAKARELDPVGAINESMMDAATDHLGLMTRSAKEIASTAEGYAETARRRAAAAVPGSVPTPASTAPQQPQIQTFRNPKTGETVRGYRRPDGQIQEVP